MPGLISDFASVFSGARVERRPSPSDEVLVTYLALSNEELMSLSLLTGQIGSYQDLGEASCFEAACVERTVLEGLLDACLRRLMVHLDDQNNEESTVLIKKLEACLEARYARETRELAALGGRPLGMFTPEGNVALSKLLDEVVAFPLTPPEVRALVSVYNSKIDILARAYPEVSDTAVREAIYEDLEASGVSKKFLKELE